MATPATRLRAQPDHFINRIGHTVVYAGELLRHRVYTRSCTGPTGSSSSSRLLSGFGIYMPWLFRWFTPLFGGGAMTRLCIPGSVWDLCSSSDCKLNWSAE